MGIAGFSEPWLIPQPVGRQRPLRVCFSLQILGNDNTGSSKASCLPRQQEPEGKTSSHLPFIPPPGKASDGNGFQLLLPDGEVNQGLQTEIASSLNWKCPRTFYFCPGCLLRASRLSPPGDIPGMCRELFPQSFFPAAAISGALDSLRWLLLPPNDFSFPLTGS